MKFKRRFGNRKKATPKKGLLLVMLLALVLLLWFNTEKFLGYFL